MKNKINQKKSHVKTLKHKSKIPLKKRLNKTIKEDFNKYVKRKTKERKTPEHVTIKKLPHKKEIKSRKPLHKKVKSYDKKIESKKKVPKYIKTEVEGFDNLLEHGIPSNSNVLVAGGPGSGKTIFCLQTAYFTALKGNPVLYISFEESEENLKNHMREFGWDVDKVIKNNMLSIKRIDPFNISRKVEALLAMATGELLISEKEVGYLLPLGKKKPSLIIFDSLSALSAAFTKQESSYRVWMEQLFGFLENMEVTGYLIAETEPIPESYSRSGVEEFLADGVIVFYNTKEGSIRTRAIEILKMRGAKHERKIVPFEIIDKGIVVYPDDMVFSME